MRQLKRQLLNRLFKIDAEMAQHHARLDDLKIERELTERELKRLVEKDKEDVPHGIV